MGQCLRSNGGLFYHGYAEFAEALRLLLEEPGPRRVPRPAGKDYVDREYSWETIDAKMETSSLARGVRSRLACWTAPGLSPCP